MRRDGAARFTWQDGDVEWVAAATQYTPDEPRDPQGRWTDAGGAGTAVGLPADSRADSPETIIAAETAVAALPDMPDPRWPTGWAQNPLPVAPGEHTVNEERVHDDMEDIWARYPEALPLAFTTKGSARGIAVLRDMPLDQLVSFQAGVYRDKVLSLITPAMRRTFAPPRAIVVKTGGQYVLLNGNHRAAAARALGHATIPAQVLDLDALRARLPPRAHSWFAYVRQLFRGGRRAGPGPIPTWEGSPEPPPLLAADYAPDQPRDEQGRWTDGGGGGGSSPMLQAYEHLSALPDIGGGPLEGWVTNPIPLAPEVRPRGEMRAELQVRQEMDDVWNRYPTPLGQAWGTWGRTWTGQFDVPGVAVLQDLPVNKIETVQRVVERDEVRRLLPNTRAEPLLGVPRPIPPVVVVKTHDHYVLLNGNHRTAAARLLGVPTIKAQVLDLDALRTHIPKGAQVQPNRFGVVHARRVGAWPVAWPVWEGSPPPPPLPLEVTLPTPPRAADYSPDQPRDEAGRWTDSGGGVATLPTSGGGGGPDTPEAIAAAGRALDRLQPATGYGEGWLWNPTPRLPGDTEVNGERIYDDMNDVWARYPEELPEAFAKFPGDTAVATLQDVPVAQIVTIQETVRGDKVRALFTPDMRRHEVVPAVVIVKTGGRYVLLNGNHRTAAARLLGHRTISAQVLDLDKLHERMPPAGTAWRARGQHQGRRGPGPIPTWVGSPAPPPRPAEIEPPPTAEPPLSADYSPDQPRDEQGRWTDGGGGGFAERAAPGTAAPGTRSADEPQAAVAEFEHMADRLHGTYGITVTAAPGYEGEALKREADLRGALDAARRLTPDGTIRGVEEIRWAPGGEFQTGTLAQYTPSFGGFIRVNGAVAMDALIGMSFRKGFNSTGDAAGPLRHELVHAAHLGGLSDRARDRLAAPLDAATAAVARRVSRYAMKSGAEFVAETASGLLAGKRYPAAVHQVYASFGGPTIRTRLPRSRRAGHTGAEDYSPDQPRDEAGRWTDGGGGGALRTGRARPERLGPTALTAAEAKRWDRYQGDVKAKYGVDVGALPGYERIAMLHEADLRTALGRAQRLTPDGKVAGVYTVYFGSGRGMGRSEMAAYDLDTRSITVNGRLNLAMITALEGRLGFFSSGESAHALTHELVHAAHLPGLRMGAPGRSGPDFLRGSRQAAIAAKVSGYAMSHPAEFVAETGAGMLAGKHYGADVMRLYKSFDGPTVHRARVGHEVVEDYSPDQPRDEAGRWTDGGGGGAARAPDLGLRVEGLRAGAVVPTPVQKRVFRKEADAVRRDYGVGVDAAEGYELSGLEHMPAMRAALDDARRLTPDGKIAGVDYIYFAQGRRGVMAEYSADDRSILVNGNLDIDQAAAANFADGFMVSPDATGIFRHELVHAAHLGPLQKGTRAQLREPFTTQARLRIAGLVSRYARVNPTEFVAETGARLLTGKHYGPAVMELYRGHGGPEIHARVGHTAVEDYSPDQPRAPAGSPEGGEWTSGGGGGAPAPALSGAARDRIEHYEDIVWRRTVETNRERGAILDPVTGEILSTQIGRTNYEVRQPRAYGQITLHSHPPTAGYPSGDGPSGQDFYAAWETRVAEMRIVVGNGTHRIGPPTDGWSSISKTRIKQTLNQYGGAYNPRFDFAQFAHELGIHYSFTPRTRDPNA